MDQYYVLYCASHFGVVHPNVLRVNATSREQAIHRARMLLSRDEWVILSIERIANDLL